MNGFSAVSEAGAAGGGEYSHIQGREGEAAARDALFQRSVFQAVFWRSVAKDRARQPALGTRTEPGFRRDRHLRRNDPDEQSRDRRRLGHQSGLERQARVHSQADRHGSEDGRGGSEDRRHGFADAEHRRLQPPAGRGRGFRGRRSVRRGRDGYHGNRQRHGTQRTGNRELRGLHPDRRVDQSREIPAAR